MLDGVGSSLKMVKFLLQHFQMLQDLTRVWPAPLLHLTTRSNNVARCCKMSDVVGSSFKIVKFLL